MEARRREVKLLPHHGPEALCTTRPAYRQGRQLTAVKVYTVNDESQHLLINGVPALGLQDDLRKLCSRFGDVKSLTYVPNYSTEKFVEAYHVQYARIQSARFAKRQIDGRGFFGGSLLACYAPEMESITETRNKLMQRRRDVAKRCLLDGTIQDSSTSRHRSNTGEEMSQPSNHTTQMCIWNGRETVHDPRLVPAEALEKASTANYGPQRCGPDWRDAGVREVVWTTLPAKKSIHSSKPPVKPSLPVLLPEAAKVTSICSQSKGLQISKDSNKKSVPPILRLVPSQVKSAQNRIIFCAKQSTSTRETSGNKSLDGTIEAVRATIKAVGVPNAPIVLNKDAKIFGAHDN